MEYVSGETLGQKIAKRRLTTTEIVNASVQVAGALDPAHQKGIIHRDIKSANIMVTEDGQTKVMDFALAKMLGAEPLTGESVIIGTVAYMSPEQAQGLGLNQRTNIRSFSVVLYEMLTGQMTFRGDRESIILRSILEMEPKLLREMKPNSPPRRYAFKAWVTGKDPMLTPRLALLPEFSVNTGKTPLKIKKQRQIGI